MRDIVVTTPKTKSDVAAKEAEDVKNAGGGYYFRTFKSRPKETGVGRRCYYVEDGAVRGFADIIWLGSGEEGMVCQTTGTFWPGEHVMFLDATSWRWIEPIEYQGFQGWRYASDEWRKAKDIGGWLDPMPVL